MRLLKPKRLPGPFPRGREPKWARFKDQPKQFVWVFLLDHFTAMISFSANWAGDIVAANPL